jgi:hypothetical protein
MPRQNDHELNAQSCVPKGELLRPLTFDPRAGGHRRLRKNVGAAIKLKARSRKRFYIKNIMKFALL